MSSSETTPTGRLSASITVTAPTLNRRIVWTRSANDASIRTATATLPMTSFTCVAMTRLPVSVPACPDPPFPVSGEGPGPEGLSAVNPQVAGWTGRWGGNDMGDRG
ncbi:hypothetical protein GCM10009530_24970 [Microbispora corallina]|uniref:Uncharacterized protein n=1 Tax=Microbispora corallina TaxID=83302 RepID=A0ABQ4G476_9ACTN|nr:hypothetical protein Mco01_48340 [Microbispora corallina]